MRIAINVMRARLTLVGFNLAIITFQLGLLPRFPGAIKFPNTTVPVHLGTDITLLMGLGLSVIAMVSFILSSAFDEQGTCTHWTILVGDVFMYLGLAQSVSGFFSPFMQVLNQVTLDLPAQAQELATVRMGLLFAGGCAWFLAAYLGPAVSLLRSPFEWRITIAVGVAYLLVLLLLAYLGSQAVALEAARAGIEVSPAPTLLNELLQPLRW